MPLCAVYFRLNVKMLSKYELYQIISKDFLDCKKTFGCKKYETLLNTL